MKASLVRNDPRPADPLDLVRWEGEGGALAARFRGTKRFFTRLTEDPANRRRGRRMIGRHGNRP